MIRLLDLIRKAETGGRYDVAYAFKRPNNRALTAMTLDEVRAYQEGLLDGGSASTACGGYQIIGRTLSGLMADLACNGDEVFNEPMQDRLALALLNRRGLSLYRAGSISRETFAHRISQEWASFPNVIGEGRNRKILPPQASYYSGDGLNHARVTIPEVMAALNLETA